MTDLQIQRFWTKVAKTDRCWLWTGCLSAKGYARTSVNRKHLPAYRVAYVLLVGPVPQGLELDHLCRNRRCVNPSHLEPVTHRVNVGRAIHDRHFACGHPETPENSYRRPDEYGGRTCRICKRSRNRKYLHNLRLRRKEANNV